MLVESKFTQSYDIVVVGGGHNGLVAAAYLGRAGKKVLLLERNPRVGGATVSEPVFPGYPARLSRYAYLVSLLPPKILSDLGITLQAKRRRVASYTPYRQAGRDGGLLIGNLAMPATKPRSTNWPAIPPSTAATGSSWAGKPFCRKSVAHPAATPAHQSRTAGPGS
jgi:hypothetical protein